MFHNEFVDVVEKAVKRYKKAQTVYKMSSGGEYEEDDFDVQLDYCEEAIIRTCIVELFAVVDRTGIDMDDVDGDDEYIDLLEEEPGRNIFQRTVEEENLYLQQNQSSCDA